LIFFTGIVKERVYKTKPASVEDLKQRITDEMSLITVNMLRNVRNSFQLRLANCQAVKRRQFEHLI